MQQHFIIKQNKTKIDPIQKSKTTNKDEWTYFFTSYFQKKKKNYSKFETLTQRKMNLKIKPSNLLKITNGKETNSQIL